ncbi:MAG TPA: META domain-containing protein [Salinimicrobium sp.]|nr:META domain-containing protein [Salinimicrobium sp.]
MRYLLLISVLVVMNSCCGTSKSQETTQIEVELDGKYQIVNLKGEKIDSDELYLDFSEKTRVSGITGCNNVSSEYKKEGNNIDFSAVLATKMYCEGKMENEKAIASALTLAKSVKSTSENEIILVSEDGTELLKAKKIE